MTAKNTGIDWKKPIQVKYSSLDRWVDARVICTDRKGKKPVVLAYIDPQYGSGDETLFSVETTGVYAGIQRVRNVPENKKHIILTYRTGSGKLSALVRAGDFKKISGDKYSVGDKYEGNTILHIAEFELAA